MNRQLATYNTLGKSRQCAAHCSKLPPAIFGCGVAIAEPDKATQYCRLGPNPPMRRTGNQVRTIGVSPPARITRRKKVASRTALCFGIINSLSYIGQQFGTCLPAGTTSRQAVSVVVQYIDGHPEKIHENFNSLAVEALREAWPCLELAWRNLIDPHFPISAK
jgi:Rap1a immunity proteins